MTKSTPVTNECEISNLHSKVKLYKQYLNCSDLSGCIGQYVFKVNLLKIKNSKIKNKI